MQKRLIVTSTQIEKQLKWWFLVFGQIVSNCITVDKYIFVSKSPENEIFFHVPFTFLFSLFVQYAAILSQIKSVFVFIFLCDQYLHIVTTHWLARLTGETNQSNSSYGSSWSSSTEKWYLQCCHTVWQGSIWNRCQEQ